MGFVKLLYELLDKALIEGNMTDILFRLTTLYLLGRANELGLQKHKLRVAALELERLRHQVREVCTYLDLHWLWYGSNADIID